jgi:hypothetical protein
LINLSKKFNAGADFASCLTNAKISVIQINLNNNIHYGRAKAGEFVGGMSRSSAGEGVRRGSYLPEEVANVRTVTLDHDVQRLSK